MSIRTENKLSRLVILFAAALAIAYISTGCASTDVPLLPRGGELSTDSTYVRNLEIGRKYFIMECAGCHKRYSPADRSPEAWADILSRHRARVTMTQSRYGMLADYVIEASRTSGHKRTAD